MAAPTLFAQGALFAASSGTSITPVIPAGDANNDIGVMCCMCNVASTFTTPSGWTILGTAVNSASQSTAWFWKRLTGSDGNPTSTTSATGSSSAGLYGIIYVYRGCLTSATPFESVGNAGTPTSSTTPQSSAITTTASERLAVSTVLVDDDNVWSSGNPPASWANSGSRLISAVGGDCMVASISQVVPSATTVSAATIGTMNAADFWRTLSFALIPEAAAPVPGTATGIFGFTGTAAGVRVPFNQAPDTRHPVVAVLAVDDPTDWNVHPFYKHIVTPTNLGNQTDVDAIETSLESAWPQRKGVVLIGEDEGCTAVMNWAFQHFEEVHHITLRRPILDFEERHARVGGATATAIDTAFGPRGNYLEAFADATDQLRTPHSASLAITGDIDIRVEMMVDSWDGGGFLQNIIGKWVVTDNQRAWWLRVNGSRFLEFLWSTTGSNILSAVSTVRPETLFPARVPFAVRVTLDAVDGANKTVRFEMQDALGGSWTQLGDPVTTAGNTSIFNASSAPVEIGNINDGAGEAFVFNLAGKVWKAEIRNSAGSLVADANVRTATVGGSTLSGSTGETWTKAGTTAIVAAHKFEASRYNPGHDHRMAIAAHWFAGRVDVWRDPADSQTPAAVTDAIAAAMRANLHDELGTEASATPPRRVLDWYDKPAYAEMEQIYEWSRANSSDGFRAADGGAAAVVPSGETISLFGDTLRSVAIDPDDSYRMPIVFDRNSAIIRSPAGVITGQVWEDGAAPGVAFEPDLVENPDCFYWPSGVCMDNGELKAVMMMREGGGGFGTFVDMHVLSIDVDTFAVTHRLSLGEPEITLESAVPDTDTGYIWLVLVDPSRLARVLIGSYSDLAQWRYWDGSTWNTSHNAAQPLQRNLPGGGTGPLVVDSLHQTWALRRYRSGWLAAFLAWFEDYIPVYYASSPEQPWTWLTNLHIPESSGDRWGARIFSYGLHWHPEMDPGPDSLMLSYNHQPIEETTYGTEEIDFFFQNLQFRVVTIHRELVFP